MSEHKNPYPDENNTGHFWDDEKDIRELSNRPPRWYMWALYIGTISIVVYSIYYPTIPWFGSANKGAANWTQISEMKESVSTLEAYRNARFANIEKAIREKSLEEILADEDLKDYSIKTAKVLFGDNCAACHGAGGQGNASFPILADDDWLYGGTIQQISASIVGGRKGNMPARMMGISDADAEFMADKLINDSGHGSNNAKFKGLYASKGCLACHGPTMKGNQALGSANLSDGI